MIGVAGARAKAILHRSRPLRFVVVGGLNTLVCYGVYAGLLRLLLPFWLANLGALVFGIGLSFHTQGRFVFGNSDGRRIFRFVACWLAVYGIQTGLIGLLIRAGFTAWFAGLLVLPGAAVISYFIQRFIVFAQPPAKRG